MLARWVEVFWFGAWTSAWLVAELPDGCCLASVEEGPSRRFFKWRERS